MKTLHKKRNLHGGNVTNYLIKFFTDLGTIIYNTLGMIVFSICALFSNKYANKSNNYIGKAWINGPTTLSELIDPR